MNHLPYEQYIFSDNPLSEVEKKDFEQHLSVCQQCQSLSLQWAATSKLLSNPAMVSPSAGFAQRWKKALPSRIKQQNDTMLRWLVVTLVVMTLFSMLIWAGYHISRTPITIFYAPILYIVNKLFVLGNTIYFTYIPWLRELPLALIALIWAFLIKGVVSLVGVWIGALWTVQAKRHAVPQKV